MATSNPYYEARTALDFHLKDFNNLPKSDDNKRTLVHWPNKEFTPDSDKPWLEVTFIPETSNDPEIGTRPYTWVTGIYQIVVSAPGGDGPFVAERLAGELLRHFKRQILPQEGLVYVRLKNPSRGAGVEDLNWYRITVDAHWRFSTQAL